ELRDGEGKLAGSGTTPATLQGVLTGTYELTARKDGRELKDTVEIQRGVTASKELDFAWGSVAVTSEPPGAEIFADGKSLGKTPARFPLPPGKYKLTAKYADWPDDTRDVTVQNGQDAAVNFEFAYGSVKITSEPRGASVILAGKEIGVTPMHLDNNVKPGPVSYELEMSGYKTVTVTGTVVARQQTFLAEQLDQTRGPDHAKPWRNSLGMRFMPVGGGVMFCSCKTRVRDYDAFCTATGHTYEKPDFDQTPDHPVVKVNWFEAEDFCKWLTNKEHDAKLLQDGEFYRLPTDAEWSFAVGLPDEGGATPEQRDQKFPDIYPWGKCWPPPFGAGNYADYSARKLHVPVIDGYEDGYPETSPVGEFPANKFGLFDMGGNVWEWMEDNYKEGEKDKKWGVLRGGSWANGDKTELLSSYRNVISRSEHGAIYGFRCVLVFEQRNGQ
ncbi:MAG TPA: SUMF1/EgtB/PvdO family nonheme iron enzyme, partial [Chthoniobacteraceae bacterium]|nr:SUMF1/EgtB/PvdO family nonheme iron enzyme [Chthoniobacteraceae bacterium]